MWLLIRPSPKNLRYWQFGVLAAFLLLWQGLSRNQQYAFFIGEPVKVAGRVWSWFLPFSFGPTCCFPTACLAMPTFIFTLAPRW